MGETGLGYKIRVMDGGLALGLTLTSIPKMGSAEAMIKQLIDELKLRKISFGIDEQAPVVDARRDHRAEFHCPLRESATISTERPTESISLRALNRTRG